MFNKCLALWRGTGYFSTMSNIEAETFFWTTPELVENLFSFLDPPSILGLAKTHLLTREVMQSALRLNWTRLIKKYCPSQQFVTLQQQQSWFGNVWRVKEVPVELPTSARRALEPIIEILLLMGKPESHLLHLLDIICKRFPPTDVTRRRGPNQVKVMCPCLEVHIGSPLGFVLLEMVERSSETCHLQVDLVSMWKIDGTILPALKSRMERPGGLITKTLSFDFVLGTQEDAEAFLALAKIADSIIFSKLDLIIITIAIVTIIAIIIVITIIIVSHSLEICGPIGEGGWRALAQALRLLPPLVLQVK